MKIRSGLVLVIATGLALGGCASGGGGGGGSSMDDILSAAGGAGLSPRNTDNTRAAHAREISAAAERLAGTEPR